jgi:ferric-dicitrate binding protein FerR (iron transport regulator)
MNRGTVDNPVYVEIQTGVGEQKEIVLPDGSEITLNENSVVSYAEKFTERNVSLIGEAFFEVERMEDSPFTISSANATTTVLGTSFNVRAYPEEEAVEVTVKEGKVALAVAEKKSAPVVLEAGTAGLVKKAEATVEKIEVDYVNADAWKTMKLEFDDVLMRDVIVTLERYFKTDIEVENEMIFECTYTSKFTKPDLDEILTVISMTIGAEFEADGNGYRITGAGCQPDN